jgi:hypothetical protein
MVLSFLYNISSQAVTFVYTDFKKVITLYNLDISLGLPPMFWDKPLDQTCSAADLTFKNIIIDLLGTNDRFS